MSQIVEMDLVVWSLEYLKQAGEKLGLGLLQGCPTKIPLGLSYEDRERWNSCTYALEVIGNPNAYQVGIQQQPDGSFKLLWDFYEGGFGLEKVVGLDGHTLVCEYEEIATTQALISEGYEVSLQMLADGTRKLSATRPY